MDLACHACRLAARLMCVLLLTGPLAAADQEALLDRWFAAQTNLHTWTADLVQTRTLRAFTQPLVATGRVWVSIPDRFRWELGQPPQTIAVRQPDQLTIVYPRLKRAERYPLNSSQPGPWRDALALLEAGFPRNRAEMASQFRLVSTSVTNGLALLSLEPRSASARRMIAEVRVAFRTNDLVLTATEMKFGDGSVMRNDFTNISINAPLAAGCFEAPVGPDYKLIEPAKTKP